MMHDGVLRHVKQHTIDVGVIPAPSARLDDGAVV